MMKMKFMIIWILISLSIWLLLIVDAQSINFVHLSKPGSALSKANSMTIDTATNTIFIVDTSNNKLQTMNPMSGIVSDFLDYDDIIIIINREWQFLGEVTFRPADNRIYAPAKDSNGKIGIVSVRTDEKSSLSVVEVNLNGVESIDCLRFDSHSGNNLYILDSIRNVIFRIPVSINESSSSASSYNDTPLQPFVNLNEHGVYLASQIAIDPTDSFIFITAPLNNQILKVSLRHPKLVSVVAGSPTGTKGTQDGYGSLASFAYPSGLAVTSNNNLYISDTLTNRISKVNSSGHVSTLCLTSTAGGVEEYLDKPTILAMDSLDNLYILQQNGTSIKKLVLCSADEEFDSKLSKCLCKDGYQHVHSSDNKITCQPIQYHMEMVDGLPKNTSSSSTSQGNSQSNGLGITTEVMYASIVLFSILAVLLAGFILGLLYRYRNTIRMVRTQSALRSVERSNSDRAKNPIPLPVINIVDIHQSSPLNNDKSISTIGGSFHSVRLLSSSSYDSVDHNRRLSSSTLNIASPKPLQSSTNHTSISQKSSRKVIAEIVEETLVESPGLSIPAFLNFQAGLDFRYDKEIGRGGSGIVYTGMAFNSKLSTFGKTVIVKVFNALEANSSTKPDNKVSSGDNSGGGWEQDSFYQELSIMYMLRQHRNIARFLGYCEKPYAMILKYYEHGSLDQYIFHLPPGKNTLNKMSWSMKCRFMKNIAKGLAFMFSRGVAHCDLKPGNVLLDYSKHRDELICVLTDFGISCLVNEKSLNVKQFKVIQLNGASLSYASPESLIRFRSNQLGYQIKYPFEYDALTSDVYSFSMCCYEIMTRNGCW